MADTNEEDTPMRTEEDEETSDSGSGSGSESEDEQVEWMVTARAKRSTAGNRLSSLIQQEEPDDELELLFAEADDDVGFEDVEADSDVQMDSSSDEEDQGPAAGADDLEGEKELQRAAKAERAKKRKLNAGIPRVFKKVRIDRTASEAPAARPKKKPERASWIPSSRDAPTRASQRGTTRESKQQLHTQMLDREVKRLRQLANMEKAQAAKQAAKKPALTQADRLAEAARVEKANSRSLSRWEEAEQIREEEQRAKLAALSNRHLEGPVITWWSGMAEWANGKLKQVGKILIVEEKEAKEKKEGKEKTSKKRKAAEMEAASEAGPAGPTASTDPNHPATEVSPSVPAQDSSTAAQVTPAKELSTVALKDALPGAPGESVPDVSVEAAAEDVKESLAEPPKEIASEESTATSAGDPEDSIPEMSTKPVSEVFTDSVPETTTASASEDPKESLPESTSEADPEVSSASPLPPQEEGAPTIPKSENESPTVVPECANTSSGVPIGHAHPHTLQQPLPPQPVPVPTHPPFILAPPAQYIPIQSPALDGSLPLPSLGYGPLQPPLHISPYSNTPIHNLQNPFQNPLHSPLAPPGHLQHPYFPQPHLHGPQTQYPLNSYPPALQNMPPPEPEVPQAPAIEYATRNYLILSNFDETAIKAKETQLQVLFNRKFTKSSKPKPPSLCAITSYPAKYRDRTTGLSYFNGYAYKEIQRLKRGEYKWSALVGAYVGLSGGVASSSNNGNAGGTNGDVSVGFAARGVPERFLGINLGKKVGQESGNTEGGAGGEGGVGSDPVTGEAVGSTGGN